MGGLGSGGGGRGVGGVERERERGTVLLLVDNQRNESCILH